ncbi:MAG: sigma-70 family RNA polymerase sigma factor [Bacillota bacterium]
MKIESIKREKNFNNETMIKLAKEKSDTHLRDKVIENNIPLVIALVNRWIRNGSTEDKEDLISVGLYGLVIAFDTYDTSKNIKFNTYAGKVVWMEFAKIARYNQMICRSKYTKISMDDEFHRSSSSNSNKKQVVADIISDDRNYYSDIDDMIFSEQLTEAIDTGSFTDTEKMVSKKFFIDGKSAVEISRETNVTRQAIHQTLKRSTKKITEKIAL